MTIVGGRIDDSSQSCIGEYGRKMLRSVFPTIAFMSCNSWSAETGVTTPTEEKAGLKQEIIANAQRKVLLADSSKYGAHSLFTVAPLAGFSEVVTDVNLAGGSERAQRAERYPQTGSARVTAPAGAVRCSDGRDISGVVNFPHLFPQEVGDGLALCGAEIFGSGVEHVVLQIELFQQHLGVEDIFW